MSKLNAYKKSLGFLTAAFTFAAVVTGCGSKSSSSGENSAVNASSLVSSEGQEVSAESLYNASVSFDDIFSDRDLDPSFDSVTAEIELSGSSVSISGSGASADGTTVTITENGVYRITGTLDDGQIIVNANGEKVQIILSGASITSKSSAPVCITDADKTFITLASGTENVLTDASSYTFADENTTEPDAAVFSADSLTFNGTGSLTINANYNDGIHCKDDVVVTGGNITINAANNGIKAKDYFAAAGGSVTVSSGNDGIKSTNSEDSSLGFIYIRNGSFNITADGDGFSAETVFYAEDGEYSIVSGGESSASSKSHADDFGGMQGGFGGKGGQEGFGGKGFGNGEMPEIPTNEDGSPAMPGEMQEGFGGRDGNYGGNSADVSDDTVSTKGIKAGTELVIAGGNITVDSADDAVHSNDTVTVSGGTLTLTAGDDGIHADSEVNISGNCMIDITRAYEGIEGAVINISGGNISLKSSDDGINASNGETQMGMGTFSDEVQLNISSGVLYVNADGDGLDSNGNMTISGGTVVVDGPTNSGNGALDSNGDIKVTGGLVVAAGASGMAECPGNSSTQNSVSATFDTTLTAGTTVALIGSDGSEIVCFTSAKTFSNIVVSSPDIRDGETYTFYTGGTFSENSSELHLSGGYKGDGSEAGSFTVSSVTSFVGQQSGIGGMGGGGMKGGRNGNFSRQPSEDENGSDRRRSNDSTV